VAVRNILVSFYADYELCDLFTKPPKIQHNKYQRLSLDMILVQFKPAYINTAYSRKKLLSLGLLTSHVPREYTTKNLLLNFIL